MPSNGAWMCSCNFFKLPGQKLSLRIWWRKSIQGDLDLLNNFFLIQILSSLIRLFLCRVKFRGLRVSMGVHIGFPTVARNVMWKKNAYTGASVCIAAHLTALAHGGQVCRSCMMQAKAAPSPTLHLGSYI